jgi:hypothetical protein
VDNYKGGTQMLASMGEAHLEWHRNARVPVGLSCPMDACDPGMLDDETLEALMAKQAAMEAADAAWEDSPEAQAVCPHGMSLWLCAGPGHYPMDDREGW